MSSSAKKNKPMAAAPSKTSKFHIDADHCFNGLEFTVKEMQEALEAFHLKKKKITEWLYNDKTPIFIDANVLLSVYFSPVPLREHLSKFLQDNQSRLYITSQVERELIRHRLEFIDKNKGNLKAAAKKVKAAIGNFETDFSKMFKELKNASVNAHFVDSMPQTDALIDGLEAMATNEHLLSAEFSAFNDKLKEIDEKFNEEFDKLFEKIDIEYRDPILSAISKINVLPPLSQSEYDFVKTLYTKLLERYDADKDKLAPYLRFPGSGEDRDTAIKDEPWGDLVIYHQVLAFMAENHLDAIFLTNDKAKLDWMKKDGEPYSYYIADAYKNTGHSLFIIPEERFFPNNDYKSIEEIRIDEDSVGDTSSVRAASALPGIEGLDITRHFDLKNINEEQFVSEFDEYSQWADNYGEKYVSKAYFIYVVLGNQGYKYSKSFEVLDRLVEDNKFVLYEKKKNGYTIPSIRKNNQEQPAPIVEKAVKNEG